MANKTTYDASTIKIIRSHKDLVRKKPTLFVPVTDVRGALHIIYEIIDNSIDELDADQSDTKKGNTVTVIYDEKTKDITIKDNGRGMPHENLFDTCTTLYSSAKMDNDEHTVYKRSGGTNGIGCKLAVYLSEYCNITSAREDKALTYNFVDGVLQDSTETASTDRGLTVSFKIHNKHISTKELTTAMIKERYEEKSYLYPKFNLHLIILKGGKEVSNKLYKGKDIVNRVEAFKPDTDIIRITTTKQTKALVGEELDDLIVMNNSVEIDVAFALSEKALDMDITDSIISYGNNIKNYTGGMHVEGLKDGVVKYFKNHVFNGKKDEVIPSDIVSGLCGFISVKVHKPEFRGQYKDQLSNKEVKFAVRDAVYEELVKQGKGPLKNHIEFIKGIIRGRIASKKVRKKDVTNAYSKDKIKDYHPLIESQFTTNPELIIVEGLSAAGCALNGSDKYNQAIYSTARPNNLIDDDITDVMKAKSSFNDIMDICGIELGPNCDVSKSKMKKIWLLTDADCDGDAIAFSILGLIAKHCPDLIKKKMVGRIVPPAYSYEEGKKTIYVESQKELFDILIDKFSKKYTLYKSGRKLKRDDMIIFLKMNFDYKRLLDNLYDRYQADRLFIEYLLVYYKPEQSVSYWKKALKKYKSIKVHEEDGVVYITGSAGNTRVYLRLDNNFHNDTYKFRKVINQNLTVSYYRLNDDEFDYTIYQIMSIFEKFIPNHIMRYKGLGEMNPEELSEVCLKENRITKIFKFDDIEDDLNKIHIMLSTKQNFKAIRSEIMMNIIADDMEIDT